MNEDFLKRRAEEFWRLAYACQSAGDLDKAIILYKRSIDTYPTAEAFTFLGWTYSFQTRLEDAIEECKRAIEVDPDFGNPWNDIGAYLIELGRLDEAVPFLEHATRAPRYESPSFPHFNLGRIYLRREQPGKAAECFRAALAANPGYLPAIHALEHLEHGLN